MKAMRAEALTERMIDLVGTAEYAERAGELGERIRSEDGTGRAVQILKEIESA